MRVIRKCTAVTAYAVTLVCLLCLAQQTTSQCVDVDQKAFNVSGTNLTQTTRDKLSDLGYYCDITLSWNVSNSTVFDQSKHDAAFALYQKLYAQATADSIEGERKSGITKDCLAFSYKVFCAYTIPKCSNGVDVESVYQEPRPLQFGLQHAAESQGLIDLVCATTRDDDCASSFIHGLALLTLLIPSLLLL